MFQEAWCEMAKGEELEHGSKCKFVKQACAWTVVNT
jgi:hypothetical protein